MNTYLRVWVWVEVRANLNHYPKPFGVRVLVEDLSLLPFNLTFRDKLEPQLRC